MAGKLAPSLHRLFGEFDDRWPHRKHVVDGWYASPSTRKSKGHNPGHNGYSHAIDVDKNGIDPMWIIRNITKREGVLWYIIWNRHLYSNTYDWKEKPYTGPNPHTDHMHIEIYQTDFAEQWQGWWGIQAIPNPGDIPDTPPGSSYGGGGYSGDFGPDYGGRDYRSHVSGLATSFNNSGLILDGLGRQLRGLRM